MRSHFRMRNGARAQRQLSTTVSFRRATPDLFGRPSFWWGCPAGQPDAGPLLAGDGRVTERHVVVPNFAFAQLPADAERGVRWRPAGLGRAVAAVGRVGGDPVGGRDAGLHAVERDLEHVGAVFDLQALPGVGFEGGGRIAHVGVTGPEVRLKFADVHADADLGLVVHDVAGFQPSDVPARQRTFYAQPDPRIERV